MTLKASIFVIASVCLLACSTPVRAQNTGTLHFVVRDEGGKLLNGCWVLIAHAESGMGYRKLTDEKGEADFPDLLAGVYVLHTSPSTLVVKSPKQVELRPGETKKVEMVVGLAQPESQSGAQLRASGAAARRGSEVGNGAGRAGSGEPSAPALNGAAGSQAGSQINESQLVGLPLNGRSYSTLATLQGTVSDPLGGSATRGGGSGSLTVSGGRSSSNTFLMDGTNIMDTGNQVPRSAAGVQLGSDALMEVQVYGVQFAAEYGRGSGGVLNSISRSGTEELHLNLFEFFRNSHMDARNFFDRRQNDSDPRLPPFKRNQFGGTLTGPFKRQKTYWMAAVEIMRDRQTTTDTSNVLDASQTSDIEGGVDPRVVPYLALYPVVNNGTRGLGFGVHSEAIFIPTNESFFTGRVDHRLSDHTSFFGHYTFDDAESFSVQNVAFLRTKSASRQQYLTLVASHIINPRLILAGRAGYTRPVAARTTVAAFEIPKSLYFVPSASQFGVIQIPGSSAFGPTATNPNTDIMNSFQFAGDLILQRGTHSLKMGADVQRYRWDIQQTSNEGATWSFTSRENFLTLERARAGQASGTTTLTVALPGSDGSKAFRQTLTGLYIHDDYRLRPDLQLNLGLRYEFATLIHDRFGRTAHLADPAHDTAMQVGPLLDHNPSLRNFSPRLGVSWAPWGRSSTVISAGFGIYYDHILEYVVDSRAISPPFYNVASIVNLNPYDYFPDALRAAAAQPGNKVQALILDYSKMTSPVVLRYNLSLRQQLPGNWRAQAMYVGARGNHLLRAYEINQFSIPVRRTDGSLFFPPGDTGINPAFSSINLLASDAQSFYNALQISANRSFGRGSSVNVSYTLSRSEDDTSNFNTTNESIQWGPMRSLDRAISDYDIRHRLTLNYFYAFPFGNQGWWLKSGPAARLLGGWRLGGILSDRTGTPINLRINVRNPNTLFAANRPNLRPGFSSSPTHGVTSSCYGYPAGLPVGVPERYYNPCAFDVPAEGTLGDNRRNSLQGPGQFTLDLSLQRDFLLDSKRRLQFRGEVFNITNKVNFRPFVAGSGVVFTGSAANPRVNTTAGSFVSTSTNARQIQLALRLSF